MQRTVEVKCVSDTPYLQGVHRWNKCMDRALELHNRCRGWKQYSVRTTNITGALMNIWMCSFDRQTRREAVVQEQRWLIQHQRDVNVENSWSGCHCLMSVAVSWIPLKYTLCRGLKIDSGVKLHEDYTAAVPPPNAIKYLLSQNKTHSHIPSKSLI